MLLTTKQKKQEYVPLFVLGDCAAAKDLSFFIHSDVLKRGKVIKKYNIIGNTVCKNLQDSSPKINVVKIVVNTPPAFACHCDSSKSALNKSTANRLTH